jgi:hypothetical protein
MTITLIAPEVHAELEQIFQEHPELCFQNVGYEYLSKEIFDAKAPQIARINEILKAHVEDFSHFNNFRKARNDGGIVLRFQYYWSREPWFRGVGYVRLDWLRDGFPGHMNPEVVGPLPENA